MSIRKKLLIVSTDQYPSGNAGAVRTHYLAKLFEKIGYEVTVVARGESTGFKFLYEDTVRYISLRGEEKNKIQKALCILFFAERLKRYVLDKEEFDAVMVTHIIPERALRLLNKYFKSPKQKFADCVEWFSPEQFKNGTKSSVYKDCDRMNTQLLDESFKVISISRFLDTHFKGRGVKSLYIPAILDTESVSRESYERVSDKIVITYAGAPGRKDYLKEAVDGLALLTPDERKRFEFKIIGITENALINTCGVDADTLALLDGVVRCMGRLSRAEVIENLKKADFSVLLRNPTQRYAKAGFPTKLVESMMCGTPLICNTTSNIGDYLKNGENAVIVDGCSAVECSRAYRFVLNISDGDIIKIKQNARKTAEEYFDYRVYEQDLGDFARQ